MVLMCGIIVTNNKKDFLETYYSNEERGDYSFGAVFVKDDKHHIYKSLHCHEEDIPDDFDIYLGHTRSPTCNHGECFNPVESHPFESFSWIVGHNGIIKNFNSLKDDFSYSGKVDSGIIPHIFDLYPVNKGLEFLEGIFGIWAYHKSSGDIYVARNSSTLYYNPEKNIVSSAKIEGAELLEEGIIYEWKSNSNTLKEIKKFEYDSPYLIL
jgi:glucosamine 6-phosphate synthetase-like amidotransferase/phosphosugar isomerase protein